MNAQHILLIMLGVIIVAIMVAVGLSLFVDDTKNQTSLTNTVPPSHAYTIQKVTANDGCTYVIASNSSGITIVHSAACSNIYHK